jgi:hypothetical protein
MFQSFGGAGTQMHECGAYFKLLAALLSYPRTSAISFLTSSPDQLCATNLKFQKIKINSIIPDI